MLSAYPACFYKEKDGGYSVIFPDLNKAATQGDDLQDAFAMAVDCLAGYLYTSMEDKEPLPPPSALSDIDPHAIWCDIGIDYDAPCFVNMVTVDVKAYAKEHFEKSVKKTLSIPAWLNDAAKEKGINFSQVLQKALRQQLGM